MKLILLITLIAFVVVMYLVIKASKDSEPSDGTVITYPDNDQDCGKTLSKDEIDRALDIAILRKKLKNIERKRK
jgi:hypothetical protein